LAITPWKDRQKNQNPDIIISTNHVSTKYITEETI
jgi:hypothetical protein